MREWLILEPPVPDNWKLEPWGVALETEAETGAGAGALDTGAGKEALDTEAG